MIIVDVSVPYPIVRVECDSLGCKHSHSIISPVSNDGGRSAMGPLMQKLSDEEWYTKTTEENLRYYCKNHGSVMDNAYPIRKSFRGGTERSHLRSSGSIDTTGLLDGVVVPSKSKMVSVTHTPEEADAIRSKRLEVEEKARLEAELLKQDQLLKLKGKFARGMKAFNIDDEKD